ncbi:MAG: TIGR04282 family arsenosugar biosynthesis glycosyltransferase [Balneolaceae bacterium]|nr:TIGR04282 family arsenosugar biosynthesis glycosyltransferase [Balneolaceae bacterium]
MRDNESLLVVFVKNPRRGKVKTRLAETMGDKRALRIYERLLDYTKRIVKPLDEKLRIEVWFSDHIPEDDFWGDIDLEKKVQPEGSLGERMAYACRKAFSEGRKKVVIIGSDCAELSARHLVEAFEKLDRFDVVIGPSDDGGYYLIGMSELYRPLFANKSWSTSRLFRQTMQAIENENLSCSLLERLNDVDTEEDWLRVKEQFSD